MKHGFISFLLLLSTTHVLAKNNEAYEIYILKKGETLSDILYKRNLKPLYGNNRWVERVLDFNHLQLDQAKNIKEGYPIILPLMISQTLKEDKIETKQAAIIRHGLIGNRISAHQNVWLHMEYNNQTSSINSTTASLRENFGAGVDIVSRNNFKMGGMIINPTIGAAIQSQNNVEIVGEQNVSANFRPNWDIHSYMALRNNRMKFDIGPTIALAETSMLDYVPNKYIVRRDQFIWTGGKYKQTFSSNHLEWNLEGDMAMTVLSQNQNNLENISVLKSSLFANINLTQDYYLGAYIQNLNYSNSANKENITLGLRLSYNLH